MEATGGGVDSVGVLVRGKSRWLCRFAVVVVAVVVVVVVVC